MTVYEETANMDATNIIQRFKEQTTMESALVCFIKAKGKCSASGSATVEVKNHPETN
tara:strand:+ start:500 stop:670 length:171 start_codon:yes stop_codon:yes gene_type:complete